MHRFLLLLLAFACLPLIAQQNPLPNAPETVEAGRQTFLGACSACHGASGQGGTAPNLTTQRQTARMPDRQLFASIKHGVPGTDMPPFPIADQKVWEVVWFVRSLSAPSITTAVKGSAEAGQALFFGKAGCSNCHRIAGRGGAIGPDLSNTGVNRTLLQLRESIFDPNARIADGFDAVTVTTASGTRIEGVAKNENNYSMQVLDKGGRLHLLQRGEIREVRRREGSLMPAGYEQKLSKTESEDLLAFLSRQSIRPYDPKAGRGAR